MRHKIATWLRKLAEWLAPRQPSPVDLLMPAAREAVKAADEKDIASSLKWLFALKALERATGAKRRFINAAIDRAVLEKYGEWDGH